jgi:nucleoside-diphosphate-sugar epimerase
MIKILITGGNGYIAKSLYNSLKDDYDVTCITRQQLDLTDGEATIQWFKDKYFDVVIHCAINGGSRLKGDTFADMDKNLCMYYNLLQCQLYYNKFIQFGSGAELLQIDTPYGLSKHVIRQSMLEKNRFYNIRIFAIFDENELKTRFIKSNIKRYINGEHMVIHQNKHMDFFYMKDLVSLVEFYILNNNLPKEIDCSYSTSKTLCHIADIINHLNDHQVEIKLDDFTLGKEYIGKFTDLGINYIGLEKGIENVYNKLKNEY